MSYILIKNNAKRKYSNTIAKAPNPNKLCIYFKGKFYVSFNQILIDSLVIILLTNGCFLHNEHLFHGLTINVAKIIKLRLKSFIRSTILHVSVSFFLIFMPPP